MSMPVRAGWVPCVGFQPPKPMVMMIEEADVIAEECERAFQSVRTKNVSAGAPLAPPPPARPGSGTEGVEDEVTPRAPTSRRPVSMPPLHDTEGKKPAMKLLMNPKGVQDFHAVQEHYQTLMNAAPPSPEVGKIVTEVQSPTGKGAELFAKRKKRMDKFIVDETTVQKAQQQTTTMTQQSFSSSSNFSSSSTGTSSYSTKKQAELERDRQQEQIL
ncbi:Synaptopodin-2-like, partial [Homarus americanus]